MLLPVVALHMENNDAAFHEGPLGFAYTLYVSHGISRLSNRACSDQIIVNLLSIHRIRLFTFVNCQN
jgi:hypothetical protein